MGERELFCVEEEAVELFDGASDVGVGDGVVAAFVVGGVANDRVIDRSEMNAYLMCPAGLDLYLKERAFFESLADLPHRQCVAAVGGDGHFRAVPAVAGDRAVDRAAVLVGRAVNESDIGLLNYPSSKLLGKSLMSLFVLRNDYQAGCVFVEAMNQTDLRF